MSEKLKEKNSAFGPPSGERLWPYGLGSVVLLIILTAAILTPDYWNYQYRKEVLKTRLVAAARTNAPPPSSGFVTNQATTGPSFELPLKTSDIYETYGKLITMLLGFVSVIGILFGYFLRKSVRELTEDVRHDVEAQVKLFEGQKQLALDQARAAQEKATTTLGEVQKLAGEYNQQLESTTHKLKALDEAIRRYQERAPSGAADEKAIADRVDIELKGTGV